MHSHGYNVFMVKVEKFLLVLVHILHYTYTGRRKYHASVCCISQVTTRIKTAEAVGPLERQVAIRSLSHSSQHLKIVRYTVINLTAPHIHATSLITFVHSNFSEFIAFTKVIIIFAFCCSPTFIETCIFIILVGYGGRLGSPLFIHEILPLEDCFVLTAS